MSLKNFFGLITQGLILGFSIAAPVGPIGMLCIRRSLQNGFKSGLSSGFGAASADAVYGMIAATGLTLIADFLKKQQTYLGILGGLFLLYLGYQTFRSSLPNADSEEVEEKSLISDFFSTFLLTLSNPITIFSFIALFGGLSANIDFRMSAFILVLGVFCGSALWWITLSTAVSLLRRKFNAEMIRWVNNVAGLVIVGFAMMMLWRVIQPISIK